MRVVLCSPLTYVPEPATKFAGVYSPPSGETKVQVRESKALAPAMKMALSPVTRFSLVGFLRMYSQGWSGWTGAGTGTGTGASLPSVFGTGKTSVGSLVPMKTS